MRRRRPDRDRLQRTARLADEGWVLPWGLGRQVDHASSAFVPRLAGEGLANRTGRRWTLVGPAGGPAAAVDPAGLVTPRLGSWSVDWWVGADDRWRLPSREPAVRQGLMGFTPVVETVMRVPGGDAVHRCYGVPGFLVLEVENRSPSPFALAFALRPCDPLGATAMEAVASTDEAVLVDGRTALLLPARPGRVATSTGAGGDVAAAVLGGRAVADGADARASCPDGLASVAVLVPVAHRATVRAIVPLADGGGPARGLPSADAVVRGWGAHGRTGLSAEIPDPLLQAAFDATRRSLLLLAPDDQAPAEEGAVVAAALGRLGRHAEADELVRALWSRQRTDGSFDEPGGGGAAGGPHLWALGEHLRLRPDPDLAAALKRSTVAAEGWLRELEAGDARAAPSLTAAAVLALASPAPPGGGGPVPAPTGWDVTATIAAAAAQVASGDPAVLERLAWLLAVGGPTWSWPDHVHPRTGAGSAGRGASPLAAAGFLLLVRDLLVIEPAPGHAVLVPVLPESWRGQALEVHGAALSDGTRLSFAVRWHGLRPALLWEATGPVRLTAPALDPAFATLEPRGEVLLGAPPSTSAAEDGTVELS